MQEEPSNPSEELFEAYQAEETEETNGEEPKQKKKKFYFKLEFDNRLIRTVIEENPYECNARDRNVAWKNVAVTMDEHYGTEGLLPRTCRDRVERLLAYHEQDHPFLKEKASCESDSDHTERAALLGELFTLRKETLAHAPELEKTSRTERHVRQPRTRSAPYILPRTSTAAASSSNSIPVYAYTAVPLTNSTKETQMVFSNGFDSSLPRSESCTGSAAGLPAQTFRAFRRNTSERAPTATGALQERTLIKELLEARRLDDDRRREELEVRREELQVQRMKLEMEKLQWEADRKERETRLALEEQERKIVLEFMRKTLLSGTNPTTQSSS